MDRREFTRAIGLGALLSASGPTVAQSAGPATPEGSSRQPSTSSSPNIAMLVHPDMVPLDLVGPQTIFSLLMARMHLVWKDLNPVPTDVGLMVQPTTTLTECPEQLDVLFVPGGLKGTVSLMDDRDVVGFLARQGQSARYVTSVCTGGLLLGAAGLLRGYRATAHWYVRDLLPLLGATVDANRIVSDRNRVTGGGVTAGLDFGLAIASALRGADYARRIQLVIEYDPKPPFQSGSPEGAGAAVTEEVRRRRAPLLAAAHEATIRAKTRLGT